MRLRGLIILALPGLLLAQHPLAQARFDRGAVDPNFRLGYVQMMFRQTPQQRAELDQLLAAQRDPSSPDYQKWLTPEEYADRFGLSAADLARVSAWLRAAGFNIEYTARGRDWIAFSGSAAQVEAALHASIRRYEIGGKLHFANASEPVLPGEIAPMVAGVLGLDDFYPHPMARPADTSSSGGHSLAPGDLWTIYEINRLYAQGIDGTGQKVAVVGETQIELSDIQQFRTAYGLPNQTIQVVPNGTNPGFNSDAMTEADLDLEWVGAIARGATLYYVYSSNATSSAMYAIDQDLAPAVSESFGGCEAEQSAAVFASVETEAKKANALGITWLASSGDSGAASCDGHVTAAIAGLAVNFPASIPEVTAVGGTEFNEGVADYWSSANNANGGSALGYIPEEAWNDTADGGGLASTGGGVSTVYPKPSWQSGAGVPNDGQRDVPDLAMPAANDHDPYNIVTSGQAAFVGGTSAATPVMAGIIALLNQSAGSNGVGNINAMLYGLAVTSPSIFHDVVTGNNVVPCAAGSPNCVNGYLGYYAGPGYDLTTGLGSVDAYNFVTGFSGGGSGLTISGLSPGSVAAGTAAFTLTVTGSGFASGAVVEWNGTALPTTFVSSTTLTASVSAILVGAVGTVAITVASGGKVSGTIYFTISPSTPVAVVYSNQRVTTQAPPASGCVLPTAITSFVTTDASVYLYFSAMVSSSDLLSNDWLAPDGTTVPGASWNQGSGNFCFTGASLLISNLSAAKLGAWTARVYDNGTLLFSIPFTVSAAGTAVPAITAVKNAASYRSGVVSPGEIVVILGTGLGPAQIAGLALDSSGLVSTQNSGTSVQFNGVLAPIVYTLSTAVAVVVPYEVSGSTAQVTVTYSGKTSSAFPVSVSSSVPGLFTSNASGSGQASAYNYQSGTFNSNTQPAPQGSLIILYATGEGQTSPGGIDGKPASTPLPSPVLPVTVYIGGVQAVVQYAGAAPGEVAGVLQLNVTVPTTVFGSAVPVVVQVGNAVSQTGVTIAIAAPAPAFTVTSQETAASVATTSTGALSCTAPPPQSSFLTTDANVYVYFTYTGAQIGDTISFNWVHPSGAVDPYAPTLKLGFVNGCVSDSLAIAGGAPASEPGSWQVRAYHNGTFAFALTFTVIAPAPVFSVTSEVMTTAPPKNGNALNCSGVAAPVSSFPLATSYAYVFFNFVGASDGDLFTASWINPSNGVDPFQSSVPLTFTGPGCIAMPFPIQGHTMATGAWQVKVFRNSVQLFDLPFTIAP